MRLQEILNEVLDSDVEVRVHEDSASTYFMSADIKGRTIQLQADRSRNKKWYVDFWQIEKNARGVMTGQTHELTGSGGELQVFSVVKRALEHIIEKRKPVELKFEAENKTTRANLYEKFLKRWNFPGYTYERKVGPHKDTFVLTRAVTEQLDEILNSKVEYEVVKDGRDTFSTKAKVGERIIHFAIERDDDGPPGADSWEAVFWETNLQGNGMKFNATGSGDELQVFAMVSDALKQFVAQRKPEKIFFSADKKGDDATRASLYDRLVRRFKAPGYEYERVTKPHKDIFVLRRTQK